MKKTIAVIMSLMLLITSCCFAAHAVGIKANPNYIYTFDNTLYFDEVYEYAYDDDGNPLLGEYPGELLTSKAVNEYGYDMYKLIIPEGVKGVIISNGSKLRTEDITDFSYQNYWLDGTLTNTGQFMPTNYLCTPEIPNLTVGDVNGSKSVDVLDAIQIQKYATNKVELDLANIYAGDVNGDNKTDIIDATLIQRLAAEKITEFTK